MSQPFLELVSLTTGPATEPATTVVDVHVPGHAAHLTVHPLRSSPFYRLDGRIGPQPLRWDASPMLRATGLQWRDLGFLARVSDTRAVVPTYAAVVLSSPAEAASQVTKQVIAVLRPSVRVSAIAWRSQGGPWQELRSGTVHAFQRVMLPVDVLPGTGAVDIDVQALDGEGKPLPMLSFRIAEAGGAGK